MQLSPCSSPCPSPGLPAHVACLRSPRGAAPCSGSPDQALATASASRFPHQMNPGLFLLPGPHLCLTAFLFFPWAILDLQPKPALAEVCNALSHPGYYPLPFAFLLARYFRHFGLEKRQFPSHRISPLLNLADVSRPALSELHTPEKAVDDLKNHLATGWPLSELPRRSFLRTLLARFSPWLLHWQCPAAAGAAPADEIPCTPPAVCPLRSCHV